MDWLFGFKSNEGNNSKHRYQQKLEIETRGLPNLQQLANEVAIFVTGLILSWLIAFIVSYIIVKIILNRMGIPWAKMNKQERVITLNSGGLACFPGIIFSLLYAVRFEEIVVSMIKIPSTVVWFLGMMIAPALGFRLAIS